jgi:glycosyltransferase involved in cell wall biosynthesis
MMQISVVITTYNRPNALQQVLKALFKQNQLASEIIIADDGSSQSTAKVIANLQKQSPCQLKHIWQPDKGFRAAAARNKAVSESTGQYIIFLDGDCIPLPHFIERHQQFSVHGYFVAGNRVLLSQKFTQEVEFNHEPVWQWTFQQWVRARLLRKVNRLLPFIYYARGGAWREQRFNKWEGVKTCNLGLWKKDFLSVNGFDEQYQGWGHEDADLAVRLIKNGIKRRDGRFGIPVLHLWHEEYDRSSEKENRSRLEDRLKADAEIIRCSKGIDQYINSDHQEASTTR